MPQYTKGFPSHIDALEHYEEHHELLGIGTIEEYIEQADRFLGAPLADLPGVEECQRPCGMWARYNVRALLFASMTEDRFIETYYRAERHRLGGRTFRQYCEDQCRLRWGGA